MQLTVSHCGVTDLRDGGRVRHSQRVCGELLVLRVLLVGAVQRPQVGLAVQRWADLQGWRGRGSHAAQRQRPLVGDAGPRRAAPGGQGLQLRVHLGVRRQRRRHVGCQARAGGVGRVRHVHARVLWRWR